MRILTPTGNKRFNELIGFLCITLAVLMALVPQPGRGVTGSDAHRVRVAAALAARDSFLVAYLGRAWSNPRRRRAWGTSVWRPAQRLQPLGRESCGRGVAGNRVIYDHAFFLFVLFFDFLIGEPDGLRRIIHELGSSKKLRRDRLTAR